MISWIQRLAAAGLAWPLALAVAQAQTQTQAQAQAQTQPLRTQTVAQGLEHPWAVAFLPSGRMLVTERVGRLRLVEPDGRTRNVVGLPEVEVGGQGGLLDLVLDSDFTRNRTLYFCFSEPGPRGNSTALARASLSPDETRLQDLRVIFSQQPKVMSQLHFGCRIAEGRRQGQADGTLFLALGERFSRRDDAQRLDNHHGKVVRIAKDGSIPADNPLRQRPGALPEIWSWGHRNPQGLATAPDGTLWLHEHGPMGGDEINLPRAGSNHGWRVVSFGRNYSGTAVGEGASAQPGMVPPLHHWTPSIAPSGMAFLSSERYGPAWRGNLLVGSLKFGYLARLELAEPFAGAVQREHRLIEVAGRIRDVRQGPDGLLYVLTDSPRGQLLRLLPP